MPPSELNSNIARHLGDMAAAHPDWPALKVPRKRTDAGNIDYLSLTFAELDAEVSAWSSRVEAAGIERGDRTLVMVRQGLPLIASVFALFRVGAIPVVIDPGMGLQAFLACVQQSQPRALLGIPVAQIISHFFRGPFRSVVKRLGASGRLTARLTSTHASSVPKSATLVNVGATDLAAILFTSGSTGVPKGVCYEHGMFDAQIRAIRDTYGIQPGEIDLPMLPIFALFNPALGMTTIVPEFDPRRPGSLDPAKIVQAIRQESVSNSFGSPTLWQKISDYCRREHVVLPSLRRVLCAGAAVPASLWTHARDFIPNGRLHSPYGATEALPVTSIASDEIAPVSFRGACVGRPLKDVDVRIINITDDAIATFGDAHELMTGEIGEIIVRGPMVTKSYDGLTKATTRAKIAAVPPPRPASDATSTGGDGLHNVGTVWHRMGDCGYLDEGGRLWFCGRKAERVESLVGTLHTEPCEQVFRQHAEVRRCALIGLGERGRQRPAIVIEAAVKGSSATRALARELRALALQHEHTATIKRFYFRARFPVDVRHNAKIHRLVLARWASTAVGIESDPKR